MSERTAFWLSVSFSIKSFRAGPDLFKSNWLARLEITKGNASVLASDRSKWSMIKDNVLNRLGRKDYGSKEQVSPGPMMWGDRVVIDNDNQRVFHIM